MTYRYWNRPHSRQLIDLNLDRESPFLELVLPVRTTLYLLASFVPYIPEKKD